VFHQQGKRLTYETWRNRWQHAAAKVGLGTLTGRHYEGVNLHDCRRAFATEAIDAGIDPQVVMRLTGHKTASMLDRYRIVKTETLADAIAKREQYVEKLRAKSNLAVLADRRSSDNLSDYSAVEASKAHAEKGSK
jgi:integrase